MERSHTLKKLKEVKTIGFLAGLALLFNSITGPGVAGVAGIFSSEGSGAIPSILAFIFYGLVSGFSVLLIIEAMQAIPGNKHFQGTVEYGTLINFYFGKIPHYLGQIVLYGALQSNAIQCIVLSAQTTDNLLIEIFKKTCGLSVGGKWICTQIHPATNPSPFQCELMLITCGFLIVIFLVIPMSFINLDDNIMVQLVSFFIAIFIGAQWISASFLKGFTGSNVPFFAKFSSAYGNILGLVILNLAFTTVVPSWINLKRKETGAQSVVWMTLLLAILYYTLLGIFPALAFLDKRELNTNILPILSSVGIPLALSKATVYLYAYVMLVTSIPVNFIISNHNLVQNQVLNPWLSKIASFILPWILSVPFLSGDKLSVFMTWTSLLFVSTANFIVPILIYFSCQKFRKAYNTNRELTKHQRILLLDIHKHSSNIQRHLNEYQLRTLDSKDGVDDSSDIAVETSEHAPHLTLSNGYYFSDGVPVDEEIQPLAEILEVNSRDIVDRDLLHKASSLSFRYGTNVSRRSYPSSSLSRSLNRKVTYYEKESGKRLPESDEFDITGLLYLDQDVPDPEEYDRKNKASLSPPVLFLPLLKKLSKTLSLNRPVVIDRTQSEVNLIDLEENSYAASKSDPNPLGVIEDNFSIHQNTLERCETDNRLSRKLTLPVNPEYIGSVFRSVPTWIPLRTSELATVLLYTTSFVTIANILFAAYSSVFDESSNFKCIPDY